MKSEQKNYHFQEIDFKNVRDEQEKKIQEKMKLIKGDYTESEKRDMVLMELKTTTCYLDENQESKKKIDIEKIKEKEEMEINKKIDEINSNESYYDKKLSVLNEISTKKSYLNQEEINKYFEKNQKIKSDILNEEKKVSDDNSTSNQTSESTYLNFQDESNSANSTQATSICEKSKEKGLRIIEINDGRKNFYKKINCSDILLEKTNENSFLPSKGNIDDKHSIYIYDDNLESFPVIQSNLLNTSELGKNINFGEPLDFCGKKVKLKGEMEIRECAPNNFMCKECMEKNKMKYNLPEKLLIGINGRVAGINSKDNKIHCIGTFKFDKNDLRTCATKFTCKSCQILNSLKNYYLQN